MNEFDFDDNNIKRTIAGNYFDRNKYICELIKYVLNAENQGSFALNGEWGSGKTVFFAPAYVHSKRYCFSFGTRH